MLQKGGDTNKDVTLDVPSVVLSSLGFGGLLYGLSTIGSYGLRVDAIAGTLVGVVALVFFFRRQLKMEKPMLQVRVLQNRKFLVATVIGMLVQGALLAAGILVPIYLQSLMGYSATVSGLVLLPGAIIMGAMGPIAGRLFDKHGPRVLALVGMGVLTLTTFCFCFLGPNMGLITLTVLYTVRLFSLSLVNMPITTWGMNALSNELVNHGTSVNNTFRQVAGSLGTAIIVSASTIATNASAPAMGEQAASFFGIDVAFAVAGVLCLIGFVMVVALVKNRPGESAAKDPDNARRTVLESIMKRDVFTLPSNATVAEAMKLLVDKHISAAPLVNAEGKAVGFVSDGDIMRYLSKRSTMMMDPVVMIMQTVDTDGGNKDFARKLDELMGMPAKSIGAKGIIGVDVHADLPEVCRVLGENHLKKVPVLDEGQVVGVINRSDITHYSMEQYLAERGDELCLIDKHAAHERQLYEKLAANYGNVPSQMLLEPTAIDLSAEEKQALLDHVPLLENAGLEIADFGGNTVVLRAVPADVEPQNAESLLIEIANKLLKGGHDALNEHTEWVLHSISCRAAIKAGDKSSPQELLALAEKILSGEVPPFCPHGRPCVLKLTRKELEKQFGRIV